MPNEFTTEQATDLARYFLGRGWFAMQYQGGFHLLLEKTSKTFSDTSWRLVFRRAGVKLPSRSRYTAQANNVMDDTTNIAVAKSATMAKRIAAALNNHAPDRRGI